MRGRSCLNCKHWHGNHYSVWGDCQYIAAELCPELLEQVDVFGWKLTVPLDPHDVKYHVNGTELNKIMNNAELDTKIERHKYKIRDLVLQFQDGVVIGEKVSPVERVFFKTYFTRPECKYYKRRLI